MQLDISCNNDLQCYKIGKIIECFRSKFKATISRCPPTLRIKEFNLHKQNRELACF